jgi:hypothetical protein
MIYTKEHEDWLKANAHIYYKDLPKAFNQTFGTNLNIDNIRYLIRKYHIKPRFIFTTEHITWLQNNRNNLNLTELTELFNKQFNTCITKKTMSVILSRYHIYSDTRKLGKKLSKEEEQWIMDNYKKYQNQENYNYLLEKDFKSQFNWSPSPNNFKNIFKRLGLNKPIHYISSTSLGHTKRIQNIWYIKVSNDIPKSNKRKAERYNYRRKAHVLYEQYHNIKIDDNKQLVLHLDNNLNNFSKDNLYLISRKAFEIYHGSNYNNQSLDTKINALTLSEIQALLKDLE